MANNPFEIFKKSQTGGMSAAHTTEILFLIGRDDFGAYLTIADAKGNQINDPNYALFSGAKRELVKHWAKAQERDLYSVDWEKEANCVYLHEHEYMLSMLKKAGSIAFEYEPKKAISFAEEPRNMSLCLTPALIPEGETLPQSFNAFWKIGDDAVSDPDAVWPLSERYMLFGTQIIEINPLGEYFRFIQSFATKVGFSNLGTFLSLASSYMENVQIDLQGWEEVRSNEVYEAQPAIIFEKIDSDHSLYMRVATIVPFLPPGFIDEYDLSNVVQIKENTFQWVVYPLSYGAQASTVSTIEKLLRKHKKGAQTGNYSLENGLFVMEKSLAAAFLFNELPNLLTEYQIMGAEKLKDYKITTFTPKLSLNISSGIDFLGGSAELDFGTEKISLLDVLNQFKKQRYVKLSDGTSVLLNQQYINKLERIFKKKKGQKDEIELSFFDLPLVEELMEERMAGKAFQRSRNIFEGFNNLKDSKKRLPKINAELRPYQRDGVKWLMYLKEQGLAGCLADDMGLGKTLQTITLLSASYPEQTKPTLIVMPRSLLFNWQAEITRFNPSLSTYTFYGSTRNMEEAMKSNLIFITYGLLRTQIEEFMQQEFHYVVLDESQQVKNLTSQAHKAVTLLKSEHRLALSGTPIENNLSELYALFHFLAPAMFGSWEQFNSLYLMPIQKYGSEQAAIDLRKKIYPFILRRLKRDVLHDLPPKIEQVLYVEMEPEHAKLYEQRRQFYHQLVQNEVATQGIEKAQFVIFQAMSELRQLASIPEAKTDGAIESPKKDALAGHLEEAFANGHKVLIFANFLAAVEEIGNLLERMGVDFVSMTGATRNRQELVNRFQNERKCQAFVMTLKTGGTGLNLTAADTVFIYDPWWNAAAENQAIDRTHRIGQQNSVTAYKMIVKDSIEEKILLLQTQKKHLVEQILATDGTSIKALTPDDIDFILG